MKILRVLLYAIFFNLVDGFFNSRKFTFEEVIEIKLSGLDDTTIIILSSVGGVLVIVAIIVTVILVKKKQREDEEKESAEIAKSNLNKNAYDNDAYEQRDKVSDGQEANSKISRNSKDKHQQHTPGKFFWLNKAKPLIVKKKMTEPITLTRVTEK